MTQPTVLSPWFVVTKSLDGVPHYYMTPADEPESRCWTPDKRAALVFVRLQSAATIADMLHADVFTLWSKAGFEQYMPTDTRDLSYLNVEQP